MAPVGDPEVSRVKDGRSWRIGAESDVAWIKQSTERGLAITSGVPPAFQAYATVVLPFGDEAQRQPMRTATIRRS